MLDAPTWMALARATPEFVHGLSITLSIAVFALPLALGVGLLFAGAASSAVFPIRAPATALIEFLRNTPLLLQMFFLYFGGPLVGVKLSGEACGVVAIAVQHGAFLSDVFVAGASAVSIRQREAARAIGLARRGTFWYVVLPQAAIRVLVPIGNQMIVAVKDTSIVSAIGVLDLTLTGKVVLERTGASFEIFVLIGLLYLVMTLLLTIVVARLERWAAPRIT